MPNWSNTPPANPRGVALPIRRTPVGKALRGIVTTDDLLGCFTHFWGGRTVPCEEPNCKACLEGQPYRWHAYLAAYDPRENNQFLFECTAQAAEPFVQYRAAHKTLRGCDFGARRLNYARNSRIAIVTTPADLTRFALPPAPNLKRCLAILWQLPEPALQDCQARNRTPTIETLSDVVDRSRAVPIGAYAEGLVDRILTKPPQGNGEEPR